MPHPLGYHPTTPFAWMEETVFPLCSNLFEGSHNWRAQSSILKVCFRINFSLWEDLEGHEHWGWTPLCDVCSPYIVKHHLVLAVRDWLCCMLNVKTLQIMVVSECEKGYFHMVEVFVVGVWRQIFHNVVHIMSLIFLIKLSTLCPLFDPITRKPGSLRNHYLLIRVVSLRHAWFHGSLVWRPDIDFW